MVCPKCKDDQSVNQFRPNTRYKSGYFPVCVSCKAAYDIVYREVNRKKIAAYKKVWQEKRKNEASFKIKNNLRRRIAHLLVNGYKSKRTVELIGCSFQEFKSHIESKFKPGMTWENYGPVWHIDHIRPCSSFDLTILEEQIKCFNYKNQQPLFKLDNLRKAKKYELSVIY